MDEDRILIYTCCDENYSCYIVLMIAAFLWSCDNIDVEIGVNLSKLNNEEENAISELRNLYPKSRILIDYNAFTTIGSLAVVNGMKVIKNSVRFITTPKIKDKYTYITDIDIPCLTKNFYKKHIEFMKNENMHYSNMVRKGTERLTGLHFCETNYHYPLILPDKNDKLLLGNDEILLYNIVKKRNDINFSTNFRPVHGIHFSPNRPNVEGDNKIPGWGAKEYLNEWTEFKESKPFKIAEKSFSDKIKKQLQKLEEYYSQLS